MEFYGWRIKKWKFKDNKQAEAKRLEMRKWINKWKNKYQIQEIFVNNAYAVQYRLLLHL